MDLPRKTRASHMSELTYGKPFESRVFDMSELTYSETPNIEPHPSRTRGSMRTKRQLLSTASTAEVIDKMKFRLGIRLRTTRSRQGFTQSDLAEHLGSSQSRVSKMEAGDPSVSRDLLFMGLLAVGLTASDIGRILDVEQRR